jgi:predicted RNA-binding protein
MCLSTVYIDSSNEREKIMQDVAHMEAENDGYTLIDLFGTREFVQGQIKRVDFVKEHFVLISPDRKDAGE